MIRLPLIAGLAALAFAACTQDAPAPENIPAGAVYVAMGSSYAAGPGVPDYYEAEPGPCFRSTGNYAHQIAQRKGLALIDASCSGATTRHLIGPRGDLPPQLDALTPDARLVTITIGGNDLNYMGVLFAASCAGLAAETASDGACNAAPSAPSEEDFAALKSRMDEIVATVRERSPEARLVFVDYLTVLPASGGCAATPLGSAEADTARELARRLAEITANAAHDGGADVLTASSLSADHDACAATPWMNGYPRPDLPVTGSGYHPNAAGMTAIADALEAMLWP